jgi:hypothetical protein
MSTRTASAPRGPALTFDPRYVNFVIEAWQKHGLATMESDDLITAAVEHAEAALIRLNEMGLLEEDVSQSEISKAIALFKALKLLKQTKTGPRNAQVTKVSVTPDGRDMLGEQPVIGGVRPRLASLLVSKNPELTLLLRALEEHGPLVQPVLSLIVGAPRKGRPYAEAIEQGLEKFWAQGTPARMHSTNETNGMPRTRRATARQLLDVAKAEALARHPAGALRQLDKVVPLVRALGLLWTDTQQLNEVIAAQYVGSAASQDAGTYVPSTPTWASIRSRFIDELVRAHTAQENGSGFATIESLRGAIGRALHLAPSVVDDLICAAREAGERREVPVSLHFEPSEDLLYHRDRHPIIWLDRAFDFVEVTPLEPEVPSGHARGPAYQWLKRTR